MTTNQIEDYGKLLKHCDSDSPTIHPFEFNLADVLEQNVLAFVAHKINVNEFCAPINPGMALFVRIVPIAGVTRNTRTLFLVDQHSPARPLLTELLKDPENISIEFYTAHQYSLFYLTTLAPERLPFARNSSRQYTRKTDPSTFVCGSTTGWGDQLVSQHRKDTADLITEFQNEIDFDLTYHNASRWFKSKEQLTLISSEVALPVTPTQVGTTSWLSINPGFESQIHVKAFTPKISQSYPGNQALELIAAYGVKSNHALSFVKWHHLNLNQTKQGKQ